MEGFACICLLLGFIGIGALIGVGNSVHDVGIKEIQAAQDACNKDEGLYMIKSKSPTSTALCKNGNKFELKDIK